MLARRQLDAGGPWTVHSVFAHACNLKANDGELLAVVEASGGNAPATLVLAESGASQPLSEIIAPGEEARLDNRVLHIGRMLHLRLTDMEMWQPVPLVQALPAAEIERRLALTAVLAASIAPAGGLAPLLSEVLALADGSPPQAERTPDSGRDLVVNHARQLLVTLTAAIRARHWSDTAAPARALSGLGPGLTPAGDDLLAGLALGLRASLGMMPPAFEAALASAVIGRTTDLAAARVRHAVAGHPDERTHQLLAALLMDATDDALPAAVRALLEYGHTSGADTLVGLLAGVSLGLG